MFGKLLKNEFRNTWKLMTIINGALVAMHLIMMVFTELMEKRIVNSTVLRNIYKVYSGTYIITIIGIQFAIFLFFTIRFYKKVYSDQGYLTHTLPVKKSAITASILISSSVWAAVTGIVAMSYPLIKLFTEIKILINDAYFIKMMAISDVNFYSLFSALFMIFLVMVCYYMLVFLSVTIGQNWKKHPLLGSVISFWLIHTVVHVIGVNALIHVIESGIINRSWIDWVTFSFGRTFNTFTTVVNLVAVLLIAIGFLVNQIIMKRRLNL